MHERFDNCPSEHVRALALTPPALAFEHNPLVAFVIRLMLCGRSLVNWFSVGRTSVVSQVCATKTSFGGSSAFAIIPGL
ncbi:MAG: hypothetical protein ACTS6P_00300 [Candidatus Hodgkinia cicadicola]